MFWYCNKFCLIDYFSTIIINYVLFTKNRFIMFSLGFRTVLPERPDEMFVGFHRKHCFTTRFSIPFDITLYGSRYRSRQNAADPPSPPGYCRNPQLLLLPRRTAGRTSGRRRAYRCVRARLATTVDTRRARCLRGACKSPPLDRKFCRGRRLASGAERKDRGKNKRVKNENSRDKKKIA